jgi:REP element-mobilizing transposase RayT
MIDGPTARFLEDYFRKVAVNERVEVIGLAILKTHVHLVVRTRAWFDLPRLAQALKGGSSHEVNRLPANKLGLRWANEYSATTVSPRHVPRVLEYLENQGQHHPGETVDA